MSSLREVARECVSCMLDGLGPGLPTSEYKASMENAAMMERELELLTMARAAFLAEIDARATVLARKRNSIAAFSRVPFEVHCIILMLLTKGRFRVQRLQALASVASAWRSAVKGHAPLWAFITAAESISEVDLKLNKSKNQPLDVILDESTSICKSPEFLEAVMGERYRVRRLTLYCEDDETMGTFFVPHYPALQELDLWWRQYDQTDEDTTCLRVKIKSPLPSLEKLTTTGILINAPWERCPKLTQLEINQVEDMLYFRDAYKIIERCQTFKKICFDGIYHLFELNTTSHAPPPGKVIELPELQELVFDDIISRIVVPLLASMQANKLQQLIVRVCRHPGLPESIAKTVLYHPAGQQLLAAVLRNNTLNYLPVTSRGRKAFIAPDFSRTGCELPSLNNAFDVFDEPYTLLPVHLDCRKIEPDNFARLLENLPTTTNIILDVPVSQARDAIKVLLDIPSLGRELKVIHFGHQIEEHDLNGSLVQDVANLLQRGKRESLDMWKWSSENSRWLVSGKGNRIFDEGSASFKIRDGCQEEERDADEEEEEKGEQDDEEERELESEDSD